jgi:hypothetical protein
MTSITFSKTTLAMLLTAAAAAGGGLVLLCETIAKPGGGVDCPSSDLTRAEAQRCAAALARECGGTVARISAESRSMAPLMDGRAFVVERPCAVKDLRAGDIVSYISPAGLTAEVTHRVVWAGDGKVICRGLNNAAPDKATVTDANMPSRVCAIVYAKSEL